MPPDLNDYELLVPVDRRSLSRACLVAAALILIWVAIASWFIWVLGQLTHDNGAIALLYVPLLACALIVALLIYSIVQFRSLAQAGWILAASATGVLVHTGTGHLHAPWALVRNVAVRRGWLNTHIRIDLHPQAAAADSPVVTNLSPFAVRNLLRFGARVGTRHTTIPDEQIMAGLRSLANQPPDPHGGRTTGS